MSLLIADMAPGRRDTLALADERIRHSWAELDAVMNRAVNAMLALPFDRARRVAVFAPNAAEPVIAYLAGLLAGISTVPASFHLTAGELAYILSDSQAGALFCG
ncbi:MAG: AMP-binding protein, partial [Sphingobium sp.]